MHIAFRKARMDGSEADNHYFECQLAVRWFAAHEDDVELILLSREDVPGHNAQI